MTVAHGATGAMRDLRVSPRPWYATGLARTRSIAPRMCHVINPAQRARWTWIALVIIGLLLSILSAPASATILRFEPIGDNPAFGDSRLDFYAEVIENDSTVSFKFYNDSTINSSIEGVYFEDGDLNGIVGFESDPEYRISFSQYAKPGKLPGGNTLTSPFETAFSADADSPTYHNGVGPDENLSVIFDLDPGASFNDLLDELTDGTLRIGIHVVGLYDNLSFSATSMIPEPATIMLLVTAIPFMIRRKRRS